MSVNYDRPSIEVKTKLKKRMGAMPPARVEIRVTAGLLEIKRASEFRADNFQSAELHAKIEALQWMRNLRSLPVRSVFSVVEIELTSVSQNVGSGKVRFQSNYDNLGSLTVEVEFVPSITQAESQAWAFLEAFLKGAEAVLNVDGQVISPEPASTPA